MRIVVSEYPKSGGTWITNLLGDALSLPKRDLYIDHNYSFCNIQKHPWYADTKSVEMTESCVIKSHELPNSPKVSFPAQFLHVVRDGRDVVVSKYFYEKEFCVRNGIYQHFDKAFDDYVPHVAAEWRHYVLAWLKTDPRICKYERFLENTAAALRNVLYALGESISDHQIENAVESNSKERMKRSLDQVFKHNTFVRKGVAGDWKNHFDAKHRRMFNDVAGDVLIELKYEQDRDW